MRRLLLASLAAAPLLLAPAVGAAVPSSAPTGPAGPVLPAASMSVSTAPDPALVAEALAEALADPALGGSVGAVVVDVATGAVLFDQEGDVARSTASNEKVFTAASVLQALGPESRITTTVTWDAASSTLTIVGAGDPTLASVAAEGSSLADLADQVTTAVPAGTEVSLRYDTSLFSGPALAPGWEPDYPALGVAAPVSALLVDRARVPGTDQREDDPALAAASAFAAMVSERGLSVDGPQPGTSVGQVVAETESVPIAVMVENMLTESDNDMAESLAHLAGAELTGTGSFESGAEATANALKVMGVDTTGLVSVDGSGLSYEDKSAPATLASVIATFASLSVDDTTAAWSWPVIPGFPVAGLTGTLADRFLAPDSEAGAGVVRAKTGTLIGVSTLAGTAVNADGRLLVFAFMADQTTDVELSRAALDRAAAALVSCACSS